MAKTPRKLQKRNPNLNASTTSLVRSNTTRSTIIPSTPSSPLTPTFPPSIYTSSPLSYLSTTSIPSASIPRATTPTHTPVSPLSQRELNRLSDIIDPLEVMNLHFPPIPATPTNSAIQTPAGSPPLAGSNSTEESPRPRHIPLGTRAIVHSPSGNAFGVHEFVRHTERPLAMWERQARIISATQEKIQQLEEKRSMSRLGGLRRNASKLTLKEGEKKSTGWEMAEKKELVGGEQGTKKVKGKLRKCCSLFGLFQK